MVRVFSIFVRYLQAIILFNAKFLSNQFPFVKLNETSTQFILLQLILRVYLHINIHIPRYLLSSTHPVLYFFFFLVKRKKVPNPYTIQCNRSQDRIIIIFSRLWQILYEYIIVELLSLIKSVAIKQYTVYIIERQQQYRNP